MAVAAFLYGQNTGFEKKQASDTVTANTNVTAVPTQEAASQSATPVISTTAKGIAVIESENTLPPLDVAELYSRVINPFVDYHKDEQSGQPLASLKISQNTNVSKDVYPYKAEAVFSNGANEGFLISKSNGHIGWWLPECLNGCHLSENFKAKYPEIAAKVQ